MTPLGIGPRFLVTTGNGRTGSAAADTLLRLGHRVRVLVSRDDGRAARWRSKGADVVVGSLFDARDLARALEDVQRVYSCAPFDPRLLHGSTLLALLAEQAGVEVVALMSGWNPHPRHPSVLQREHWMVNNLFRRQTFDVIHVNPGLFAFTYLLGDPAPIWGCSRFRSGTASTPRRATRTLVPWPHTRSSTLNRTWGPACAQWGPSGCILPTSRPCSVASWGERSRIDRSRRRCSRSSRVPRDSRCSRSPRSDTTLPNAGPACMGRSPTTTSSG